MSHSDEAQLYLWMMDGGSHGGDRWATAELLKPLQFSKWTGKRDENNKCIDEYWEVPAGTTVRINMSSRFGWLGLHSNLQTPNGYEYTLQAVDLVEPVKRKAESFVLTNIARCIGETLQVD